MAAANYQKPDTWSEKAQKEGYPARSVYKLKELDEKFGLIPKKPAAVLDLGAAPGSWSLYILKKMRPGGTLTAADLNVLSPAHAGFFDNNPAFRFLQGDFTEEPVRSAILGSGLYSLIVSDAAPATSGNRGLDSLRSAVLAEAVLQYVETSLAPGGGCVIKFFQGAESAELLKKARVIFEKVKTFKPSACRPTSFETYLVGKK